MPGHDLRRYADPEPIPEPAPGLVRLGVHRFQAWCEERWTDTEVRRLASQTRLIQARQELAEAVYHAQRAVHTVAAGAEDAASDRVFRRTLRMVEPGEAHRILRIAVDEETALLQREHLRRYRLAEGNIGLPEGLGGGTAHGGLEVDLSSHQIESLALRAVTQFQQLPQAEREAAYSQWKQELDAKFPAYAVAEITRRADALRALL